MQVAQEKPQRVTVVIEQNKGGTWGVAAYLETASGRRYRRALKTCSTYEDAAKAMKHIWQTMNESGKSYARPSNDVPARPHG